LPPRSLRTDSDRVVPPLAECASRPGTERFDACELEREERPDRDDDGNDDGDDDEEEDGEEDGGNGEAGDEGTDGDGSPVRAAGTAAGAAGSGAIPQVSQYRCPPPMSSMVPPQSGRRHPVTRSPSRCSRCSR
jgi:hypothetical protein